MSVLAPDPVSQAIASAEATRQVRVGDFGGTLRSGRAFKLSIPMDATPHDLLELCALVAMRIPQLIAQQNEIREPSAAARLWLPDGGPR